MQNDSANWAPDQAYGTNPADITPNSPPFPGGPAFLIHFQRILTKLDSDWALAL